MLDVGVGHASPGRVALRLPITNRTDFDWHGTVRLRVGDTVIPVDIGEVRAGRTGVATLTIKVPKGQLEVNGSLLIGP